MEKVLKTFLESIEEQSWNEIDSLALDFGPENRAKTEQTRSQVIRQVESYRQKELSAIAQRQRLDADACREESRKRLFEARAECAREAESALMDRLREFTESSDYPVQLVSLLRKGLSVLQVKNAVVYLRREDRQYEDQLKQAMEGCSLEFREGQFCVGGLIVESPEIGRRVDFSFDTTLGDAQDHFGEIFGLGLT